MAFAAGGSAHRNTDNKKEKGGFGVQWEPGAVFLAGLLDGVNPCAFSAMVFLISALALAGRSKRTMLAIGLSYACGVFITYSLIGAGLLGGLRRFAVSPGIRRGTGDCSGFNPDRVGRSKRYRRNSSFQGTK